MAEKTTGEMQATLGLTGLTINAMALIAPGAFLWLTFYAQATEGASSPAMWIGILIALLLCLATAVSYAELAKLYPGTGSSYYFAEQVIPESREGMALCAPDEIHRRLGLTPLLLDIPRCDGGSHGNILRLHRRDSVAEFYERLESRTDVHDARCHFVLLRGVLYRSPWCYRLNGRQHRDQRYPDIGPARVFRHGDRLSGEPRAG